jgi:transcriptional regulator GlxA family with amidase domain
MSRKRNVALLLFDDVEVLDFAGPFEVFAVTDELRGHDTFNVYTVAASPASVRARNGLVVVPDFVLESAPTPQVLIVPGGFGTRRLLLQPHVLDWIAAKARTAELVMSVCTGALVLGTLGLLDGLRATTHHENLDELRTIAPRVDVVGNERFTDNGKILTAAGISAGIDCSLHVVERLVGAEAATATAEYMEYRRA